MNFVEDGRPGAFTGLASPALIETSVVRIHVNKLRLFQGIVGFISRSIDKTNPHEVWK